MNMELQSESVSKKHSFAAKWEKTGTEICPAIREGAIHVIKQVATNPFVAQPVVTNQKVKKQLPAQQLYLTNWPSLPSVPYICE
ncbi:hypothetical protein SUGI_0235160 [Cryptomeria japonica]|nr:hypothetical protein SUGI_0235160 [Cryptomeria japonica]